MYQDFSDCFGNCFKNSGIIFGDVSRLLGFFWRCIKTSGIFLKMYLDFWDYFGKCINTLGVVLGDISRHLGLFWEMYQDFWDCFRKFINGRCINGRCMNWRCICQWELYQWEMNICTTFLGVLWMLKTHLLADVLKRIIFTYLG